MVLDFLNEQLPWRCCKNNKVDEVKEIKEKCLADPDKHIWRTTTSSMQEIKNVFYQISSLQYADRPNYAFIREQLISLLQKEEAKEHSLPSLDTRASVGKKRKCPSVMLMESPMPAQLPQPADNKLLNPEKPCANEANSKKNTKLEAVAAVAEPSHKTPVMLDPNFAYCLSQQRLSQYYPQFYRYPSPYQLPFCSDGGFAGMTMRPSEEQKELLPPGYYYQRSSMPIPLSYPTHQVIPPPAHCHGQEEKTLFKIEVDKEYYAKLYGGKGEQKDCLHT